MRNQPGKSSGLADIAWRLLQVPRLYVEFVRFRPSRIGTVIALIPAVLLLVALLLLVM